MDLQNITHFNEMCRICLQMSSFLVSISLNNIITMIKACASVNIWLNDELPNQICKVCYKRLQDSFDLKQLCEKSDNHLRQVVDNCKKIKCEISINEWDEKIFSKCIEIQNTTNDCDEQIISKLDNSVDDCDAQTLYDYGNSTEKREEEIFSNNYENSKICDEQMFVKQEISVEGDVEESFLVKNEVLHSDEEIREDNSVESKEAEKIPRCDDEDKSEKLYACEQCDRKCKTIQSFRNHMRRTHKKKHNQENEKSYVCEQCDSKFQYARYFGYHMRRVHKTKGTKCRYCAVICYHEEHLKVHEDSHTQKPFKCEVCNGGFSHRSTLIIHMDSHKTERPFYCAQCDTSFKNKWHLKIHNQNIHENMQKYTACHICGKSVVTYGIQRHLLTHSERETISCKLCDRKFFYEKSLKEHVRRIHEKGARKCRHLCNICGLGTISVPEFEAHMRTHTGEKPYKCDKCDKKYSKKMQLKMHISRKHLDERKYVCSVCSRAFYDNNLLTNHMRTHTGERPFQCQICEKTFGFKSGLYTHMKMHTK